MMQAVTIREPGDASVLTVTEHAIPEAGRGEITIDVHAAGVNRPDVLQRTGRYPVPADASPLPGLEVAGTVRDIGTGVSGFTVGDRVAALVHGGGYAEVARADARHALALPDNVEFTVAAALPETLYTVYYNVVMRAALAPGEILLVHGGSSGIGTMAIQLATALGARVVTTAGSDAKCAFCEQLGAERAFNYRDDDFFALIRDAVGGVDVILDMVAGSYTEPNLTLLNRDGRYVLIAFLGGSKVEINLLPILRNRLTLTGSTLRPQSADEKAAIADGIRRDVWPFVAQGLIRPPIHASFPLAQAAEAHRLMESSEHMGKIVLTTRREA